MNNEEWREYLYQNRIYIHIENATHFKAVADVIGWDRNSDAFRNRLSDARWLKYPYVSADSFDIHMSRLSEREKASTELSVFEADEFISIFGCECEGDDDQSDMSDLM